MYCSDLIIVKLGTHVANTAVVAYECMAFGQTPICIWFNKPTEQYCPQVPD